MHIEMEISLFSLNLYIIKCFLLAGTHGHMKCVFNSQLKSQDTVLMQLYKRVFPKWNYNDYVHFVKEKFH